MSGTAWNLIRPGLAGGLLVMSSMWSGAQTSQQDLRAVDPGVEDREPLGVGRADLRADLEGPTAFDRVYALPGPNGTTRYARANGALWAVFERGEYVINRKGQQVPLAPGGMTFYIGLPPELDPIVMARSERDRPIPMNFVSTRNDLTNGADPETVDSVAEPAADPSILADETYRRERIAQLLTSSSAPM